MKLLAHTLSGKHLETIYQSFLLPLIDYGDIIYHAAPNYALQKLDQIHYQAACIILGCIKGTSTMKTYTILNWTTLTVRRQEHLSRFFF